MNIKIISGLLLSTMMWQCTEPAPAELPFRETLLNILVVDQSESFDYGKFQPEELARLIRHDAQNYDTWLAVVPILDQKSIEQELLMEGPFVLDTLSEHDYSIYQQPDVKAHNQQQLLLFDQKLTRVMDACEAVVKEQQRPHSDVNGALLYALRLSTQQRFQGVKIRVIILSDLDHDIPGDPTLGVFPFPATAIIYPVSLNRELDLPTIFPNNRVDQLVGFRADFFIPSP